MIIILKLILHRILPKKSILFIRKLKKYFWFKKAYQYDFNKYWTFSRTTGSVTSSKLAAEIIIQYHIIEKGLTMPLPRLGFGKDIIISLCNLCIDYIKKYGTENEQLITGIQVILEYENYHKTQNYSLDTPVVDNIKKVSSIVPNLSASMQKAISKNEYFKDIHSSFLSFSNTRASVRNYTNEDVPMERILSALELAKNTPSACNRQAWRTYLFTNKEKISHILEVQGGNRGFGHLSNKLILICGEIGAFGEIAERNQVYIDGGMYAMNLLYSLHYFEIGACILNCSITPEKDLILRKLCGNNKSEVFIAMIACGIPPESFKIANSKRYNLKITNTIVN
ncbi:MAG: nitroreductase family protein [Cyclobacteriaceae bacterium]